MSKEKLHNIMKLILTLLNAATLNKFKIEFEWFEFERD